MINFVNNIRYSSLNKRKLSKLDSYKAIKHLFGHSNYIDISNFNEFIKERFSDYGTFINILLTVHGSIGRGGVEGYTLLNEHPPPIRQKCILSHLGCSKRA